LQVEDTRQLSGLHLRLAHLATTLYHPLHTRPRDLHTAQFPLCGSGSSWTLRIAWDGARLNTLSPDDDKIRSKSWLILFHNCYTTRGKDEKDPSLFDSDWFFLHNRSIGEE